MSVINQVLKDLDDRQHRTSDISKYRNQLLGIATQSQRYKYFQPITWAILFLSVSMLLFIIWDKSNLNFNLLGLGENVSFELSGVSGSVKPEVVDTALVNKNIISDAVWRSKLGGIGELAITFREGISQNVGQASVGNGATEFVFNSSELDVSFPMLNFKNGPLEFYEISQRGDDFVLTVKPKSHMTMSVVYGDRFGNDKDLLWTLRFEPAANPPMQQKVQQQAQQTKQKVNMAVGATAAKKNTPVIASSQQTEFKKRVGSSSSEAEYRRALALLNKGMTLSAAKKLKSIISAKPSMHKARELLANLYLRSGREVEAFLLLDQGIKLDNSYMPFVQLYAQTLIQRDRLIDAKRVLLFVESSPNLNAEYFALFAGVNQRLSEHEQAVTNYMQALENEWCARKLVVRYGYFIRGA